MVAWVNSGTGAPLGQTTVDSSGVATLSLPLTQPGAILVTANYLASGTAVSATGTLAINVSGITAPVIPPTSTMSGSKIAIPVGISSVGGYTGPVTLTCSGMPSPGSCSLSPSTLSFTSSSSTQTTTLTVNTSASTTSELRSIPANSGPSKPGVGSIVFALICPLLLFSRRSRHVRGIKTLLLLLISAGALTMATMGCSGGTSPTPSTPSAPAPPASNPSVAAGTYTVNVVAQAGSASVTIPVSVTVQ